MQYRRRTIGAVAAVAVAMMASTASAGAAEEVVAEPEQDYVIVDPRNAVSTSEGTFYPTGPLDDDTVVVVANDDGTLPGGLSEARLGELLASGDEALNAVASQGFEVAGGGQSAGVAATASGSPRPGPTVSAPCHGEK